MAAYQNDSMLDAALNYIKTSTDGGTAHLVASSATSYAQVTASSLATFSTASGNWTLADASSGTGRQLTFAGSSGTVSTTGTVNHLAFTDGSAALYYVTTVTSQPLVATNTFTVPSFKIQLYDASAS